MTRQSWSKEYQNCLPRVSFIQSSFEKIHSTPRLKVKSQLWDQRASFSMILPITALLLLSNMADLLKNHLSFETFHLMMATTIRVSRNLLILLNTQNLLVHPRILEQIIQVREAQPNPRLTTEELTPIQTQIKTMQKIASKYSHHEQDPLEFLNQDLNLNHDLDQGLDHDNGSATECLDASTHLNQKLTHTTLTLITPILPTPRFHCISKHPLVLRGHTLATESQPLDMSMTVHELASDDHLASHNSSTKWHKN